MKVAFIKQALDVFGPWAGVRWEDMTPEGLLSVWPGKATLWEATCLLKADWFIIPQQIDTEYIKDAVLKHPGRRELVMNNVKNVVDIKDVPFEQYDIVISFDPILDVPKYPNTVFAYYMQEHWDPLYQDSLKKSLGNYDLFLAHMLDAPQMISSLPQPVSFPYLRDPDTMRSVFGGGEKEESVWIDWRTFEALGPMDAEKRIVETAAKVVTQWLGVPVRYKSDYLQVPYGISNPLKWGDAAVYLRQMGRSRYYVSVGRDKGAGQGLCDAASLGCICIGEQNKPFHRMICHPDCLCADTTEMLHKFGTIVRSPKRQKEFCDWQDRQIREHFIKKPLSLLNDALRIKAEASLTFNGSNYQSKTVSPEAKIDFGQKDKADPAAFTIFSMPRAFTSAFALIQENAIRSWMELRPRPEIILFGDDDGTARFSEKYHLKHVPDVRRNEFGTPLLNHLFLDAQRIAANEVCAYVNADIILMGDFAEAIKRVGEKFKQFLMIGRRWDFDISEKISFDAGWEELLRRRVLKEGSCHKAWGIDYFAFRKGLWPAIPPFALGRFAWDNWLVDAAITSPYPVVDASDSVFIVHQNHDFSHVPGGKQAERFKTEEQRNREFAPQSYYAGYTTQAIWTLTPEGVKLKPVDKFFQNENLSMVLRCIDMAYLQAPESVKKQYESYAAGAKQEDLAKLQTAARTELISGAYKDAAKLVLLSTNTANRISAVETFKKGVVCLRDGNAPEAIKHLEKTEAGFAGLPNLYFAIATAHTQLGNLSAARQACQVEISLQPENDGARKLLCKIEEALGEHPAGCQPAVTMV